MIVRENQVHDDGSIWFDIAADEKSLKVIPTFVRMLVRAWTIMLGMSRENHYFRITDVDHGYNYITFCIQTPKDLHIDQIYEVAHKVERTLKGMQDLI